MVRVNRRKFKNWLNFKRSWFRYYNDQRTRRLCRGEEIRKLLLQGETDRWSAETEILLFTAARSDHLERIILPALKDGKIVICDRFTDSTRMYQGMRGPKLRDLVDNLTEEVINCDPDLTIIIDIDPEISLRRAKSRKTAEERFEDFGVDLQKNEEGLYKPFERI